METVPFNAQQTAQSVLTGELQASLGGPYISLGEIAAELGVSKPTIRNLLVKAGLKGYTLGTGRKSLIRYSLEDVRAWLESRVV